MKYCIILGNNFEDIEAVASIDILRRAGVPLDVYGVGGDTIKSRSMLTYKAERVFMKAGDVSVDEYDGIILPGGPGTKQLYNNEELISLIRGFHAKDKSIFAICAAPTLLDKAGVLTGKRFTCFPGSVSEIKSGTHVDQSVVVDGKLITSQGAGTAVDFGLALVAAIVSPNEAKTQAEKIVYRFYQS